MHFPFITITTKECSEISVKFLRISFNSFISGARAYSGLGRSKTS